MFKNLKNRMKNEKGMTLVELLAVIVILGIVAAIAIVAIGNIIENSKVDAVKADAIQLINGANLYKAQNGKLPTSLNEVENTIELNSYWDTVTFTEVDGKTAISGTGYEKEKSGGGGEGVHVEFKNATIKDINEAEVKSGETIGK